MRSFFCLFVVFVVSVVVVVVVFVVVFVVVVGLFCSLLYTLTCAHAGCFLLSAFADFPSFSSSSASTCMYICIQLPQSI